jgi:hypothetical protein
MPLNEQITFLFLVISFSWSPTYRFPTEIHINLFEAITELKLLQLMSTSVNEDSKIKTAMLLLKQNKIAVHHSTFKYIWKIHWVLHTNKWTNCISCISLKLFTLRLSLLLHVSIAHRISSSGSTYNSEQKSRIKIMSIPLLCLPALETTHTQIHDMLPRHS